MKHEQNDIITTKQLALGFDGHALVTNVNLTVASGEFIGILGSNGSGKSTFLRALLGLVKPLNGQIHVLNKIPAHGDKNIGYMPQMRSQSMNTNLTSRALLEAVCDGLSFGLPIYTKKNKLEIEKMLALVNATAYADRPFQQLSGGERQRIYLAQALLGNPAILLLDEPLSNLDPKFQDIFMGLLKEIQARLNVTILLTAHDPNPLLPMMSRVLFFANGRAAIGKVDDIITSAALTALYGTAIDVVRFKNRVFVLSETSQNILGEVSHHHD